MMFFETELPSLQEKWHNDALLAIWGFMCLAVTGVYIITMFVAGMINLSIMEVEHTVCTT